MPSTYSPKLKFELIAPGEQPGLWGNTTNKNVGELIEQAIAGVTTLDLTSVSGNYQLTSLDGTVDQARSAVVSCQGTAAGAVSIVIPTSTKLYVFRNACGQTVTIKTAGQIGGVVLANGEANSVFCDGTNALAGLVTAGAGTTPVSGGGTGQTSFTSGFLISPSPGGTTALTTQAKISLLGDVANTLPVANGGTGASTLAAGGLLVGNGTGAVTALTGGFNGYVPTWSTATNTWIPTAPTPSGVATVFGRSGTVTAVSTDYSSFYYPLTGNPSNFVTSSALSGYAQLASSPTFTGGVTANGFLANGAVSIGDQKFTVSFSGYQSGVSPQGIQIGSSGKGVLYDGNYVAMGSVSGGGTVLSLGASAGVLISSTDNVQRPSGGPWLATVSDIRHKENVVDYTKGLEAITALRPVNYTFKGKYGEQTNYKVCTGLIAQEVLETPLSSMVGTNEDGFHNLDSNQISYALINSVKELSAQIKELQAEVAALKAK